MSKKTLNLISGTMIAALLTLGCGFASAEDSKVPAKTDDKSKTAATPAPAPKHAAHKVEVKKDDKKPAANAPASATPAK